MVCVPADAAPQAESAPPPEPEPEVPQPAPSAWRTIPSRGSRRSRRTQAAPPPPPPEPQPAPTTQSWATWQREFIIMYALEVRCTDCFLGQRTLLSGRLLPSSQSSISSRRRRPALDCSGPVPLATLSGGNEFRRISRTLYDMLRSILLLASRPYAAIISLCISYHVYPFNILLPLHYVMYHRHCMLSR